MTEREISAYSALGLTSVSVAIATLFVILYFMAKRHDSPTKFAASIRRKYVAMSAYFFIMSFLHFYTYYFNLNSEVGFFTFKVRTSLRWGAVGFITIAALSIIVMIFYYWRAGNDKEGLE